jgi:hypothetical protein
LILCPLWYSITCIIYCASCCALFTKHLLLPASWSQIFSQNIRFCDTSNLCYDVRVRDQFSLLYKIWNKGIVLYVWNFACCVDVRKEDRRFWADWWQSFPTCFVWSLNIYLSRNTWNEIYRSEREASPSLNPLYDIQAFEDNFSEFCRFRNEISFQL